MTDRRAQQKARARRAIADAGAALAAERRHYDFSMQEVAERAGVSLRTVYNHFASREALLDGLAERTDELFRERGGMLIGDITDVDQLLDGVRRNFPIFEELDASLFTVEDDAATIPPAGTAIALDHDIRTRRVVDLVRAAAPALTDEQAMRVGLLVRGMISHRAWVAMTKDYGMSTQDAVVATTWGMRTLLDAARRGDVDGLEPGS